MILETDIKMMNFNLFFFLRTDRSKKKKRKKEIFSWVHPMVLPRRSSCDSPALPGGTKEPNLLSFFTGELGHGKIKWILVLQPRSVLRAGHTYFIVQENAEEPQESWKESNLWEKYQKLQDQYKTDRCSKYAIPLNQAQMPVSTEPRANTNVCFP